MGGSKALRSLLFQTSYVTRTFLLAVLCSRLSITTAFPIPSLPASAPNFYSGPVPSALSLALSDDQLNPPPDIDPSPAGTDIDFAVDDDDAAVGDLDYGNFTNTETMSVDAMGNVIEKDHDKRCAPSPHIPISTISLAKDGHPQSLTSLNSYSDQNPDPPSRTLFETFSATLSHLSHVGFWKGLLGSFLVFWALMASTVTILVVVAIKVRRMGRDGSLRSLDTTMTKNRRKARKRSEEEVSDE